MSCWGWACTCIVWPLLLVLRYLSTLPPVVSCQCICPSPLLRRRPLKPQPFETEVGWWGAKQLNGYRHTEGAAARLAACRRARK